MGTERQREGGLVDLYDFFGKKSRGDFSLVGGGTVSKIAINLWEATL